MKKHTLFVTFIISFVLAIVLEIAQNGDILGFSETTATAPGEENILPVQDSVNTQGKININTATVPILDTLDGIGEEYAGRIIKFRNSSGKFEVIHDIMKVPGIGEKRFLKIKDKISVE